MNKKLVSHQQEWNKVFRELEGENLKLASYDNTLTGLLGNIAGKKILDYGAGPGVLALALQKMGAKTKVWDINAEMREKSGSKIGKENIYQSITDIPKNHFDAIICNLVLCIVPEDEVRHIVTNMAAMVNETGHIYIGFCNPKIFNIEESNLDYRIPTGNVYEDNHDYKKVKKEGGYEIIETHRPIEWYEKIYAEARLKLDGIFFTPEYALNGKKIEDFVIFKLSK